MYFITSGSGASLIELQTYFWQGVAELEANFFEVLEAIYDGAKTKELRGAQSRKSNSLILPKNLGKLLCFGQVVVKTLWRS